MSDEYTLTPTSRHATVYIPTGVNINKHLICPDSVVRGL